jgi:hypothetical protein
MGAGSVVFEVLHCAFISFVALQIVASSLVAKGGLFYMVHTIDNISLCDILFNHLQDLKTVLCNAASFREKCIALRLT